MKRITLSAFALLAALVLAACNVTVEVPGPPDDAIVITANSNPAAPLDGDRTYAPGEEKVFRVTVPSTVANEDLLYVELSRDLRLEVRPGGTSYPTVSFSANSYQQFGSGLTGIMSTGTDLSAEAINDPVTCRGSCVILEDPASEFFVRVVNTGSTTIGNVDLFVFGDVYSDAYEPSNDSSAGAQPLPAFDSGSIETVNDVDWWRIDSTGEVVFDTVTEGIEMVAYITDASGNVVTPGGGPFYSGDSLNVIANIDYVRVWASDANVAAASSNSTYYLEYVTPFSAGQ